MRASLDGLSCSHLLVATMYLCSASEDDAESMPPCT